jgi:hypothetical protein
MEELCQLADRAGGAFTVPCDMDTEKDRMTPPPSPSVTAGPPVTPFPLHKSHITLVPNDKLKDAVRSAVGDASAKIAISIVDTGNKYAVGAFNGDKEYFTGSVIKLGVLYAAHALLNMVRRYNTLRAPKSADKLLEGLHKEMDSAIEQSAPLIFGGASPAQRLPTYKDVFAIQNLGGKLQVDFKPQYKHHMKQMIVDSNNLSGAVCIHGLGFSYINGALEQGDFFDSSTKKGVWAAGDFGHGWAPVRIPCENYADGTAQGATTDALARLMAMLTVGGVLETPSHIDMSKLLREAAVNAFVSRSGIANHLSADQVTHSKLGIGTPDISVISEVERLQGIGSKPDRTYIVAWQNVDNWESNITKMIAIIKGAIIAYES